MKQTDQSAQAIASVTVILRALLQERMADQSVTSEIGSDVSVTALPPNRIATEGDERPQINVFLTHVAPSATLPSFDPDAEERSSEGECLRLNLFYLVSVYGARDLQIETLLGHVLQRLQDSRRISPEQANALLRADGQKKAAGSAPAGALGPLEICPQFASVEELSRLWSCLQACYRPSVIYKVSSVTIRERPA